ncbi:hypothetical protein PQR75_05305 [Paraburkholderia fungorum]|uniref:hypothetical protein n=1 Tax=Paraburkholderia fungorum TaxID=134537 RepID=UPI0038B88A29
MTRTIPTQELGNQRADALRAWIAATPLSLVPRNQFKKVARSTVCNLLGITPSTIRSNRKILDMFDALDRALPPVQEQPTNMASQRESSGTLEDIISENKRLKEQLEEEQRRHAGLQYLEDTAVLVRQGP